MAVLVSGYGASPAEDGLGHALLGRVRDFSAGLLREWQLRRAYLAVSRLSDGELSDIGIGRGFEEEAVRHGRGRRLLSVPARPAVDGPMPLSWTEWR